jgi:hypothetical protein
MCQTAEQLVVTTLRLLHLQWTSAIADPKWSNGLRAARLAHEAIDAMQTFFLAIAASTTTRLQIHGLRCVCMGKDELTLLRLIALMQRGQHRLAADELCPRFPPTTIRVAILYVDVIARALMARGLRLPLRHSEAATFARIPLTHANGGLMLIQ